MSLVLLLILAILTRLRVVVPRRESLRAGLGVILFGSSLIFLILTILTIYVVRLPALRKLLAFTVFVWLLLSQCNNLCVMV